MYNLLRIILILILPCSFLTRGHAQILFSTHSGTTSVAENSTYTFYVDVENLPKGAIIRAITKGGIGVLSYNADTDNELFELVKEDTSWRISIADNRVTVEIDAQGLGVHTHALTVEVYSSMESYTLKKVLKTWEKTLEFSVERMLACVELKNSPMIYEGIETEFEVAVAGIYNSRLHLSATGANLRATPTGYTFIPTVPPGSTIILIIAARMDDGRTIIVDHKEFFIHPMPDPAIQIFYPGPSGTAYPILLLTHPVMNLKGISVQSWELELTLSGKVKKFKGVGNVLNEDAMKSWRKLKPGDSYLFKNVRVSTPEKQWLLSKQGIIAPK